MPSGSLFYWFFRDKMETLPCLAQTVIAGKYRGNIIKFASASFLWMADYLVHIYWPIPLNLLLSLCGSVNGVINLPHIGIESFICLILNSALNCILQKTRLMVIAR